MQQRISGMRVQGVEYAKEVEYVVSNKLDLGLSRNGTISHSLSLWFPHILFNFLKNVNSYVILIRPMLSRLLQPWLMLLINDFCGGNMRIVRPEGDAHIIRNLTSSRYK
jgi:hypothetical protein